MLLGPRSEKNGLCKRKKNLRRENLYDKKMQRNQLQNTFLCSSNQSLDIFQKFRTFLSLLWIGADENCSNCLKDTEYLKFCRKLQVAILGKATKHHLGMAFQDWVNETKRYTEHKLLLAFIQRLTQRILIKGRDGCLLYRSDKSIKISKESREQMPRIVEKINIPTSSAHARSLYFKLEVQERRRGRESRLKSKPDTPKHKTRSVFALPLQDEIKDKNKRSAKVSTFKRPKLKQVNTHKVVQKIFRNKPYLAYPTEVIPSPKPLEVGKVQLDHSPVKMSIWSPDKMVLKPHKNVKTQKEQAHNNRIFKSMDQGKNEPINGTEKEKEISNGENNAAKGFFSENSEKKNTPGYSSYFQDHLTKGIIEFLRS